MSPEKIVAAVEKAGYKARVRPASTTAPSGGAPVSTITAAVTSRAVWRAEQVPEPVRSALAHARSERKPVLLDFSAKWCAPCQRLARETLADAAIAKTLEGFVVLAVDADKDAEATRFFGVKALPNVRLLLSDGTEVRALENFVTPSELAPLLREVADENRARAAGSK